MHNFSECCSIHSALSANSETAGWQTGKWRKGCCTVTLGSRRIRGFYSSDLACENKPRLGGLDEAHLLSLVAIWLCLS
jgi:hypothetical protein